MGRNSREMVDDRDHTSPFAVKDLKLRAKDRLKMRIESEVQVRAEVWTMTPTLGFTDAELEVAFTIDNVAAELQLAGRHN